MMISNKFILYIFYFSILIFLISCSSNDRYISFLDYSDLNKEDTVSYESIKLQYDKNRIFEKINIDGDSIFFNELILNRKFEIKHLFPDYEERLTISNMYVDTLVIEEKKFCIQEILSHNDKPIYPKVIEAKIVNQEDREILIVEGIYQDDIEISHLKWTLLFDITNKKNVKHLNSKYHDLVSSKANYFYDFNRDKKIDFCFLTEDTLKLCNISNDKLIPLQNYFLVLKKENNENVYCIDSKKSNWFYSLRKKTCGKEKFNINIKESKY